MLHLPDTQLCSLLEVRWNKVCISKKFLPQTWLDLIGVSGYTTVARSMLSFLASVAQMGFLAFVTLFGLYSRPLIIAKY